MPSEFSELDEPPRTDSGFVEDMATREQAAALRDLLTPHGDAWVTFRSDLDLRLDGRYSNHITPEAIYALDASRTAAQADFYASRKTRRNETYFHHVGYVRRPMAVVFAIDGRVASSQTYSDFHADRARLMEYVSLNYPKSMLSAERWNAKREYDPYLGFKALIWMTEQVADDIVGSVYWGDTFKHHPDKPRVWRELITAVGVDALEDRINFLTGDCGHQLAVLNPDAIRVLASFDNPAASAGSLSPSTAHPNAA